MGPCTVKRTQRSSRLGVKRPPYEWFKRKKTWGGQVRGLVNEKIVRRGWADFGIGPFRYSQTTLLL